MVVSLVDTVMQGTLKVAVPSIWTRSTVFRPCPNGSVFGEAPDWV